MKRSAVWPLAGQAFLVAALALSLPARADFELTAPDGRRVLLKDDGTWHYADAKDTQQAEEPVKQEGEATLTLERRIEEPNGCGFGIALVNNLPYEIENIVPEFSAYRANGVIYDTVRATSSFSRLKPGDRQTRELMFRGITCGEIVRLQVGGGDRCTMGDLVKWSDVKGECLGRVRVVASDLVRFDK